MQFSVAATLFVFTVLLSIVTYLLFEAPYRALFRYYLESPRILHFMLPVVNANGGKPSGSSFGQGSMLNLNPNFLFSPHYNLVTNLSSRAESEASSLANYSIGPPTIKVGNASSVPINSQPPPTVLHKSVSAVSMVPNGEIIRENCPTIESDFNNNKNPGEAY